MTKFFTSFCAFKAILLCIVVSVVCGGCSTATVLTHTEYVVLVPETIPSPPLPKLVEYRPTEPITSYYNFKAFQVNQLELIDHITLLKRNLTYYELQILQLKERQQELENANKSQKIQDD